MAESNAAKRSRLATQARWKKMADEFGLLTAAEISLKIGATDPDTASGLHAAGELIEIERPDGPRYPGFQVDSHHKIWPVIKELIRLAAEHGWSQNHLALWIYSPNGWLGGDRPVDRLEYPETVINAAQQDLAPRW